MCLDNIYSFLGGTYFAYTGQVQANRATISGVEINAGPVASGFAVGPVKSAIHWPGWPVKF